MQARDEKKGQSPAVWTLFVLAIGLALGVLLALTPRPGRSDPGPRMFETFDDIDVVLSTVALALLVVLLFVYSKTYTDTSARFALGLIFVLAALLFQTLLTSPILFGIFGHALGGIGPFVLVADAFKAVAFSIFLYLSLQ